MPAAIATGSTPPDELGPIPHGWLVRDYLPQVRLLSQARLAVTHGGNNSVTEAIGQGVPLLVLPFSTDQFAGAAAIERTGIGRALDPNAATVDELAAALAAVRDSVGMPAAAVDRPRTGRAPRPGDRLRAADRPRARDQLSHRDRVALRGAIALHERRVGVVARTRPHLGGVVQGVHPALVPHRRLTEQGAVREVPRGVLEPPAAEALVLTAVRAPRCAAWSRTRPSTRRSRARGRTPRPARPRAAARRRCGPASGTRCRAGGPVRSCARRRPPRAAARARAACRRRTRRRPRRGRRRRCRGCGRRRARRRRRRCRRSARRTRAGGGRTSRARIRTPARARAPAARARSP